MTRRHRILWVDYRTKSDTDPMALSQLVYSKAYHGRVDLFVERSRDSQQWPPVYYWRTSTGDSGCEYTEIEAKSAAEAASEKALDRIFALER